MTARLEAVQSEPLVELILRSASWLEERLNPSGTGRPVRPGWLTPRSLADLLTCAPRAGYSLARMEAAQGDGLAFLAEMSVEAARRRSLQGQPLGEFLLECKAIRQAVLDLLDQQDLEPVLWAKYTRMVERSFDLLEQLICRVWGEPAAPAGREIFSYARGLMVDRNRYQAVFERLPTPVILIDGQYRLELWNTAAECLSWNGQRGQSCQRGTLAASVFPWMSDVLVKLGDFSDEELVFDKILVTPAGARDYQVMARRVLNAADELAGIVLVLLDVTERRVAEEQVGFLGSHDHLTGLYNRAFFEAELERLARGQAFPISIVMLDVDDLQLTNDALGFAAGNELLRRVAGVLRSSFRAEDVVARIGGDEFAVLLRGVDGRTARAVCQRLHDGLRLDLQQHASLPLAVSLGIATAARGDQLSQALIQADEQMRQDKNTRPVRQIFNTSGAARVM